MEEQIGTASFVGVHEKMPKGIERFEDYPLYNSEGFYIRTPEGKQIVINDDWKMIIEAGHLSGKDIEQVVVNYESVVVCTKYGNHRIPLDVLASILRKRDYEIYKKRSRTYINPRPRK